MTWRVERDVFHGNVRGWELRKSGFDIWIRTSDVELAYNIADLLNASVSAGSQDRKTPVDPPGWPSRTARASSKARSNRLPAVA